MIPSVFLVPLMLPLWWQALAAVAMVSSTAAGTCTHLPAAWCVRGSSGLPCVQGGEGWDAVQAVQPGVVVFASALSAAHRHMPLLHMAAAQTCLRPAACLVPARSC